MKKCVYQCLNIENVLQLIRDMWSPKNEVTTTFGKDIFKKVIIGTVTGCHSNKCVAAHVTGCHSN